MNCETGADVASLRGGPEWGPGQLPPGMHVLERGWLSANNIVFVGGDATAVVDTGYVTHSRQTLELIDATLGGLPLRLLVNTHLHSDHCGGNAALQARYPGVRTLIPPGDAEAVRRWDTEALTYAATGQSCPRFAIDGVLQPGTTLALGGRAWEVHAAPGHDPHSVVLFEPFSRVLLSADALWANGFGVVFPELDGEGAFDEVAATLDLIERLDPLTVVPGHGPAFTGLADALARARRRLDGFVADPRKHALHGAKVLLKFKLLELQRTTLPEIVAWGTGTRFLPQVHARWFADEELAAWARTLVDDLVRSGAARLDGNLLENA